MRNPRHLFSNPTSQLEDVAILFYTKLQCRFYFRQQWEFRIEYVQIYVYKSFFEIDSLKHEVERLHI